MGQTITFYPLGNAETCMVELSNKKKILFDYANMHSESGDLKTDLCSEFSDIKEFDVVMFSHAHDDHVKGASEFFYLEYAKKYQSDERVKIKELWISSAFILDTDLNSEDAKIIRNEARYRLKNASGIKVFAEPENLEAWLKKYDLTLQDVADCIVHAGEVLTCPELGDEVQFFVHAPFSDECEDIDNKNDPSIVLQMRLKNLLRETNILITGDTPYEILGKIVEISKLNGNEEYLAWDLYDIPHHCSYTGLNSEDHKGDYRTTPTENVKWLLRQGQPNAKMVASCDVISEVTSPPHIQAERAYKYNTDDDIEFYATMEYPSKSNPSPLVFTIDNYGISKMQFSSGVAYLKSAAPRAGQ